MFRLSDWGNKDTWEEWLPQEHSTSTQLQDNRGRGCWCLGCSSLFTMVKASCGRLMGFQPAAVHQLWWTASTLHFTHLSKTASVKDDLMRQGFLLSLSGRGLCSGCSLSLHTWEIAVTSAWQEINAEYTWIAILGPKVPVYLPLCENQVAPG